MRLLRLFLVLAVLVIVPFLIWGDFFFKLFEPQETEAWFSDLGKSWAWLAGIGLLVSDLFLPIPGTVVMSALGYVYGPWLGGVFSVLGSMLSGLLAYGLCRKMGRRAAERIAGREDLAKGELIFGGAAGGGVERRIARVIARQGDTEEHGGDAQKAACEFDESPAQEGHGGGR